MNVGPSSLRLRKDFVLLVATLSFFVQGLSLFSYPALSGVVSSLLTLSNTQSGLITSSFGLAYAALQIPGGALADRYGESKTLLISLLVAAVAPAIMIIGKDFDSAVVSRAISGAACGIIVPSSVRLTSSWFPKGQLGRAMGVYGSGWAASQVFSFLVLPLFISGTQWELPLVFVILFSLGVAGLATFPARWRNGEVTKRESLEGQERGPAGEAQGAGRNSVSGGGEKGLGGLLTRQLFALVLPNFAALAVSVGVLTWAPTFLGSRLGLTYVDAGRIAALIGIGGVIASLLGGYGAARIGTRAIIGISTMIAVITPVLLGFFTDSLFAASLWLIGVGLAEMLYLPADFALVPYASVKGPKVAGLEFGIFNTLSNLGTFVSPLLIGYALDSGAGFPRAFTLLGVLALSGVVGALLIRDNLRGSGQSD